MTEYYEEAKREQYEVNCRVEGIRYAARRMREDGVNVEGSYDPKYATWLDALADEQDLH